MDMEVANHWSCTWPMARWMTCLFAARAAGNLRHHLLNNEYVVRSEEGQVVKSVMLKDVEEVLQCLRDAFGIAIPEDVDRAKVAAMVALGQQPHYQ